MRFFGRHRPTTFQIIAVGFTALILIGALLLSLPVASREKGRPAFMDCLFTATSAVCVTGLVVKDTAAFWSPFGQAVILFLIQIGGMGVVTAAVSLAFLSGRKIGLMQRSVMQESISAPQVGGIVRLTRFFVLTALAIEATGAVLLSPPMILRFGIGQGIWNAVFHSVSAFCNAGFDLMGREEPFSSLTSFSQNGLVNVTVMLLITVGGIGFLVWDDLKEHGIHWKQYRLQSKAALLTSAWLVILPALWFFLFEMKQLPAEKRILPALFQSVTLRTAGFNTVDLNQFSGSGQALMIACMLIGGSPGSTAGGMKTTTVAVLLTTALAVFRRNDHVTLWGRRLDGFRLEMHRSEALLFVQADARLIVQVIINLLDNAIKYAPAGTAIEVSTKEEEGKVIVRIADQGPGIPEDQKPYIFDLFYSGNNLSGDSRRGLGLGLALCQSIMKAHSGAIAVRDNTPHGAVFELSFPKAEVSLDE